MVEKAAAAPVPVAGSVVVLSLIIISYSVPLSVQVASATSASVSLLDQLSPATGYEATISALLAYSTGVSFFLRKLEIRFEPIDWRAEGTTSFSSL